jgi:hypothetical protein
VTLPDQLDHPVETVALGLPAEWPVPHWARALRSGWTVRHAEPPPTASVSCRRELTPSFRNALPRW